MRALKFYIGALIAAAIAYSLALRVHWPEQKDETRVATQESLPAQSVQPVEIAAAVPTQQEVAAVTQKPDDAAPVSKQERVASLEDKQADLATGSIPPLTRSLGPAAANPAPSRPKLGYLSYLADYAYSETPPDKKPADIVLAALKDVPVGSPVDEVIYASDAFGLDVTFMKAVAKIESDFDPKQRTGSYIGLFQLSHYEFDKFGSGDITDPRDNAIAAAYKFVTAAILFEIDTHKKATRDDLYLIHQQGWQGAAEHVAHPNWVAWKSMCATDEGREKGEKWCKRAVWANTLPEIKKAWKTVDNLTSSAFVDMWKQRISLFYSRYSDANATK